LVLDGIKIQEIISDPDCIKCNGKGVISTVGIGEYEEWIDSDICECVKFKDIEIEENNDWKK